MKILIVEDEAALGSAVRERVREAGHVADWFTTLEDARAAMAASLYDFVLLDLGLPDGDGRIFLREIRRMGSPVAVLIATARTRSASALRACPKGRMIIWSNPMT